MCAAIGIIINDDDDDDDSGCHQRNWVQTHKVLYDMAITIEFL